MSLSKSHGNWALKLHTKTAQPGAAVYVDGIQDLGLSSALATLLAGGDNSLYNSFGALGSGAPVGRVQTNDLKALLDAIGLTGMLIDADGNHPGVVMYFESLAQGATRGGAGTHQSVTMANGIAIPRSIELSHGAAALAAAELLPRQDGATGPVAFNEADSLPGSVYPGVGALWTLGPWKISGTAIEGLERVSIDTGIELEIASGDQDFYPTFIAIKKIQPSITLSGRHIDITSTLTEDGLYKAAAEIVGYAQKRAEGSSLVAVDTAEHIKFTMGKCRLEWTEIAGDPKTIGIKITPWATVGASPVSPLAINTASAIT